MKQQPQGYYETGLLLKANCPPLQGNKAGSLARLGRLTQKLQREPELFAQHDQIIKDKKHKESLKEQTMNREEGPFIYHTSQW